MRSGAFHFREMVVSLMSSTLKPRGSLVGARGVKNVSRGQTLSFIRVNRSLAMMSE